MHLIYLLLVPVLIVGVILVIASMRPPEFTARRSIEMAAPAARPFALVNDLHQWDDWSPWAKLDPVMKITFDGPSTGAGSSMAWVGNSKVGQGITTIVETKPDQMIRLRLEFLRPFKATNEATFTFESVGDHTAVTWSMTGHCNLVMKVFHLFMNMDKMIGRDFEKGLASIKAIVETSAVV